MKGPFTRQTYEIKPDAYLKYSDVINILIGQGYLQGQDGINHVKPSHGGCCTCQTCGYDNENCICRHNILLLLLQSGIYYEEIDYRDPPREWDYGENE